MRKIKIRIKDIEKSDFSKCCLKELSIEKVNEGDIFEGNYFEQEKAVDFVAPTGVPCVAWYGITCEEVIEEEQKAEYEEVVAEAVEE